jgi:hypothetical protein
MKASPISLFLATSGKKRDFMIWRGAQFRILLETNLAGQRRHYYNSIAR